MSYQDACRSDILWPGSLIKGLTELAVSKRNPFDYDVFCVRGCADCLTGLYTVDWLLDHLHYNTIN